MTEGRIPPWETESWKRMVVRAERSSETEDGPAPIPRPAAKPARAMRGPLLIAPATLAAAHAMVRSADAVARDGRPIGNLQPVLPGLDLGAADPAVAGLPLPVEGGGRGVPLGQALWLLAVLAVPRWRRTDVVPLVFPLQDLVRFAGWSPYRPGRHPARIAQALEDAYRVRIGWRGGEWACVRPVTFPAPGASLDFPVRIDVSLPPGSDHGPMVDVRPLERYRPRSAAAWRAWVRLCHAWDRRGSPLALRRGQLAALCYDASACAPAASRKRIQRSISVLRGMEGDGLLSLDRVGRTWRVGRRERTPG